MIDLQIYLVEVFGHMVVAGFIVGATFASVATLIRFSMRLLKGG